ncbi:19938_t:CDS:1, partial [Racocetra persica]
MREDLPKIPIIDDPLFRSIATGYNSNNESWEILEYLGDRVLTSCLLKIAGPRYIQRYKPKHIEM